MDRILFLSNLFNVQRASLHALAIEGITEQHKLFTNLFRAEHMLGRENAIKQFFGSEELFERFEAEAYAVLQNSVDAEKPTLDDTLQLVQDLRAVQLTRLSDRDNHLIFSEDQLWDYIEECAANPRPPPTPEQPEAGPSRPRLPAPVAPVFSSEQDVDMSGNA